MDIPFHIRGLDKPVQRAYIAEFNRVMERSGSAITAVKSADALANRVLRAERSKVKSVNHISKKVNFTATIQELSGEDLRNYIPDGVIEAAKSKDKNPFFAFFEIGKDGLSDGQGVRKIWSFSAIKEMAGKIKNAACSLFEGHTSHNNPNPKSFGNIVWSYTKKAGKGLKAYAIAHITDNDAKERIKNGELDICSIEGVVDFERSPGAKEWFVNKVEDVTGLALSSSKKDKAGFQSAGLIGTVQELAEKGTEMAKENVDGMSVSDIDLSMMKVAKERLNIKPSDLFSKDDIVNDDTTQEHIKTQTEKLKEDYEKKIEELEGELNPLKEQTRKQKVTSMVDENPLLEDKNQGCREYIKKQVENLDISDCETDADIKKVTDEKIKSELETIKSLGITFSGKADDGKDGDGDGDKEPGEPGGQGDEDGDKANPANNDLIPATPNTQSDS